MSAPELRAKAARLRDLALRSKDESARSELLYLAGEYELAAGPDDDAPAVNVAATTFPI